MKNEDSIELVEIKKVSNGYVVRVITESEEKELVFHKQLHVMKLLKEVFRDN